MLRGKAAKIRAQSLKSGGAIVQNDDVQKQPGVRQAAEDPIQPSLRAINAELYAHKGKKCCLCNIFGFLTLCQHSLM